MRREKKRTQQWLRLAVMSCLVILSCASLWGQATASSSLQGTVTDKTQAVVTKAEVTLTNKDTGAVRTTAVNNAGEYRFDLVPAGTYNVKVVATGFSRAEAKDVRMQVGGTTTQNFTLQPGGVSETVEVTAAAPLVDQAKTDVSLNISPEQIEDLPLNGRDFGNLAYLAPGVKPVDSYDPTKNRISVFGINGASGRNVNLTVDGIDNKDNTVGGPVMQLPLEAVQEFKISTQRFSAANGRSEGAAIELVTKSGSNNWHGAAYGFFRDQALNAIDFESSQNGGSKPPYSRQQFGGRFGGPLKKDKLFFTFELERQREHTSIPEDPTAFKELSLVTALGAQPASVIPTPYFDWRYHGKLDYTFNSKHNAYLSYSAQSNNGLNDQSAGTSDLTAGNFTKNELQLISLALTSNLSSTVINTGNVGFQYWNNLIDSQTKTNTITFPGSISFGTNTNVPQQSIQRKWQFKDDLSIIRGHHNFKTGFDYLWEPTLGGFFEFNPTLELDFSQAPSAITLLPNKFATPGLVTSMSATSGDPSFTLPGGTKMFGLYFQDTWKATNRLTVDLGLRWDKDYNLIGGTAVTKSRTFQELKAIGSPLAASVPHDDNLDFSPRVGFAYDLTGGGKHILRGGYGIYYGQIFLNIPLFMIQQQNATIFQGTFALANPTDIVPGTAIQLQNWRFGIDPLPILPPASSSLAPGATGRLMDPNYRNPYSQAFNFGYTWQLTPHSVIEAEYVHELGLHESKTINVNPVNPATGTRPLSAAFAAAGVPVLGRIDDEQSIGRSRYDGFNLSYRQRMWQHFSMEANYTLAKASAYKGNAAAFRNRPSLPNDPFNAADFGPVPNDERHHITVDGTVDLPWGIRFSPIMIFGSARPYDSNIGYTLGFGSGFGVANIVVDNSDPNNLTKYKGSANAAAVRACLAAGTCHFLGFDSFRGSPFFQLDSRVSKTIKIKEKMKVEALAQLFNMTNRANFGNNYSGNLASSSFQKPIGYINPSSSLIPRAFAAEFGFKFNF